MLLLKALIQLLEATFRNRTFVLWDAAGCPPAGDRPGEGEIVATRPDGSKVLRYDYRFLRATLPRVRARGPKRVFHRRPDCFAAQIELPRQVS
jgi:hypothetical protein